MRDSWHRRTAVGWNSLPDEMRLIEGTKKFKIRQKEWVESNIAIHA